MYMYGAIMETYILPMFLYT